MMKKMIFSFALFIFSLTTHAENQARLNIKINDSTPGNKHFLCLYGIGCLSIHAGNRGKVFPINPIDMNNIRKVAIADLQSRKLHLQLNDPSCQVDVHANQTVTVAGELVVKNNVRQINHLHCLVA